MTGSRLLLALAGSFLFGTSTPVAPPRIQVQAPRSPLHAGETWNAVVTAPRARPRAFVVAGQSRRLTFRLRRRGGRYHASVVFPSAGDWRYGVVARGRRLYVGSVRVRPPRPVLRQPFGVLEEPRGTVLVGDWWANRIFRLDLAARDGVVVARVPGPRDLAWKPDGKLLVASAENVLELDPTSGATRPVIDTGAFVGGIAVAADGTMFLNEDGSTIERVTPNGTRTVLATGLNGVHGLLVTGAGLVVCESFAGRVLLLRDGAVAVLAQGLANPSYAAPAPDGGLYVTEFAAGRVTRVAADGSARAVAEVPMPGPISLTRAGRLLVGTLDGSIYGVTPETGAVRRVYP